MHLSGSLTVPRLTQEQVQVFMASDQTGASASLWVNMPLFFRLKFMPLHNVHIKILGGHMRISGF
jgi:hypothetical protein